MLRSNRRGRKLEMDFIIEILIYLIFAGGIWVFHWCMRHKNVALTIITIIVMVIDVFVWLKLMGKY